MSTQAGKMRQRQQSRGRGRQGRDSKLKCPWRPGKQSKWVWSSSGNWPPRKHVSQLGGGGAAATSSSPLIPRGNMIPTFLGLAIFQEKPEFQSLYEHPTHWKCWQLVSSILRHLQTKQNCLQAKYEPIGSQTSAARA